MSRFVKFVKNEYPTVGVEQEFHLIDAETGDLLPCVDDIFKALDEDLRNSVTYELLLAVLEHNSPVCYSIDDLAKQVKQARRVLANVCENIGAKLVAAGSHPFSDWRKVPIVKTQHYKWVTEQCVYLAKRLLSFGLHVHVGMQNEQSAMYALYEMRQWIYPLLAMSANSPYFEGHYTGLASTRTHLFGSMPRTGMPPYFSNITELESFYNKLIAAGDITRPGDLWWVLRPQPPLGTVELRVFDMPTDIRRLCAFAAITQAALALYQDRFLQGIKPSNPKTAYLEQNRWKAMRFGLNCDIIEPVTGEIISMRNQLERMLDMIMPKAEELHSLEHIKFAKEILNSGNEAELQIKTCESLNGDLLALELEIAKRTLA
ncbi:MAG: YbdK family carboxylate-amine ligase [Planctomycetes bacterium]|nr:YbdK family carboxylate-amine ligase [Planctomycetota bacterium]